MTASHSAKTAPPQLSTSERRAILDKVLAALDKRFYKPEKLMTIGVPPVNHYWLFIEAADTADGFRKIHVRSSGRVAYVASRLLSRQRPQSFQPRRAERNLSCRRDAFRRAVDISGCALRRRRIQCRNRVR